MDQFPLNGPTEIWATKRRAPRQGCELPVRCKHGLVRSTVILKDMTRFGARIEGVQFAGDEAARIGEAITLLLPGQPANMAFVVWTRGQTLGLEFSAPLPLDAFEMLIHDYAIGGAADPGAVPIAVDNHAATQAAA